MTNIFEEYEKEYEIAMQRLFSSMMVPSKYLWFCNMEGVTKLTKETDPLLFCKEMISNGVVSNKTVNLNESLKIVKENNHIVKFSSICVECNSEIKERELFSSKYVGCLC